MSSDAELERLQGEVQRLRAHNRRYRELVQNLASRLAILEARASTVSSAPPALTVFESFGRPEEPRDVPQWEGPLPEMRCTPAGRSADVTSEENCGPLVPSPGWRCLAVDRPQLRIGFTLFGMTGTEVEEAVAVIEQRQVRSRDFVPVFVTDCTELRSFRCRGYAAEYLRSDRALEHRLAFLSAKWGLHKLVHLGRPPVTRKD